jgi:mRNA interferase MazF
LGVPAAAVIALVPFPFSDLSANKLRPAVVIADVGKDDWLLCMVTSNPYGDPAAIRIWNPDLATGGLRHASYVRPGKLFTAHASLVGREIGSLLPAAFDRIRDEIKS